MINIGQCINLAEYLHILLRQILQVREHALVGLCGIFLVDGEWGPWSEWSVCSKLCDTGVQQRHRSCNRPQFGGAGCIGDNTQMKKCNLTPCKGKRSRLRVIHYFLSGTKSKAATKLHLVFKT